MQHLLTHIGVEHLERLTGPVGVPHTGAQHQNAACLESVFPQKAEVGALPREDQDQLEETVIVWSVVALELIPLGPDGGIPLPEDLAPTEVVRF